MPRFGWRTVTIRAEFVNTIEDWALAQPYPPKVAQVVHDALRDWFEHQDLPQPRAL